MSIGKVGVIRKIDPGMASQAALLGTVLPYVANTLYQGSGSQRRNQQRWKAGKDAVRRTPAALAAAGKVGVRGVQAAGRGVAQVLGAPGRAYDRGVKGVKRLGYELSGGDNIIHPTPTPYSTTEEVVNYHASLPQEHTNYLPRQYMEGLLER